MSERVHAGDGGLVRGGHLGAVVGRAVTYLGYQLTNQNRPGYRREMANA